MPAPVVLLLTAAHLPELAADDQPLISAFANAGWDPRPAVWSGPIPDADLAVIRSCWDYTERLDDFLAAIDAIGRRMPLWNPAATVRWNADKRYLLELAGRGVATPPLLVTEPGSPHTLDGVMGALGSEQLVLKPVVGASGKGVLRIDPADEAAWQHAVASAPMLVQRFVPEVVTDGEWSLMWFHGRFSHAVRKRPRAGEIRVKEEHGGTVEPAPPGAVMLRAAERALAAVPHPWHYARVDGVMSGGEFLIMELELIEPQLFLTGNNAASRMPG